MQKPCATCGILLQSHDRVRWEAEGTYSDIPSTVVVRIVDSDVIWFVPGTLRHKKCPREE